MTGQIEVAAPITVEQLANYIKQDTASNDKKKAKLGDRYYEQKHDILDTRLFWIDKENNLREQKGTSNVKIAHGFFTEQIDQKVQYLLSNPIDFLTDDDELEGHLKNYLDDEIQVVLQDVVEGASVKGYDYLYFYHIDTPMGQRIKFRVADMLNTIQVLDTQGNTKNIIRYYNVKVWDAAAKKDKYVLKAEVWDDTRTWYYTEETGGKFKMDAEMQNNPRYHTMIEMQEIIEGTDETTPVLKGKGFGRLPFIKLMNNKKGTTDLEPIKSLVDDYDLMASSLSNNLIDFDTPVYAVKGYKGDDVDKLINNIRAKKVVKTSEKGDIDVKTVDIPYEARESKLKVDKENIYKFGMAFDSTQIGDGNITNVVIKSRYSLLDLKCNKMEARLKSLIREMLSIVLNQINEEQNTKYTTNDIDIVITRATPVNESDLVKDDETRENTKNIALSNLFQVASRLDDETILERICDILDLDKTEIQERLSKQDYSPIGNMGDDKNIKMLLGAMNSKKVEKIEQGDNDE